MATKSKNKEASLEDKTPEPKMVEISEADYLAAQLHEARAQLLVLRGELLAKQRLLVQKDQIIVQREETILVLESRLIEQENAKLRETHNLDFGKTFHKEEETGKVYWVEPTGE